MDEFNEYFNRNLRKFRNPSPPSEYEPYVTGYECIPKCKKIESELLRFFPTCFFSMPPLRLLEQDNCTPVDTFKRKKVKHNFFNEKDISKLNGISSDISPKLKCVSKTPIVKKQELVYNTKIVEKELESSAFTENSQQSSSSSFELEKSSSIPCEKASNFSDKFSIPYETSNHLSDKFSIPYETSNHLSGKSPVSREKSNYLPKQPPLPCERPNYLSEQSSATHERPNKFSEHQESVPLCHMKIENSNQTSTSHDKEGSNHKNESTFRKRELTPDPEGKVKRSKTEFAPDSIQEISAKIDFPCVGLDHVFEIQRSDPMHDIIFRCDICSAKCGKNTILLHLKSFKHQLRCLKKFRPLLYQNFRYKKKSEISQDVECCVKNLEQEIGRGVIGIRPKLSELSPVPSSDSSSEFHNSVQEIPQSLPSTSSIQLMPKKFVPISWKKQLSPPSDTQSKSSDICDSVEWLTKFHKRKDNKSSSYHHEQISSKKKHHSIKSTVEHSFHSSSSKHKKKKKERVEDTYYEYERDCSPGSTRSQAIPDSTSSLYTDVLPDTSMSDFYCNICDSHMATEQIWETHIVGKRHRKNLKKLPGERPSKIKAVKRNDLTPLLDKDLEEVEDSIVGLDYISENLKLDKRFGPTYACYLCSGSFTKLTIIDHLTSIKHRLKYMERVDPNSHKLITDSNHSKYAVESLVTSTTYDLEQRHGRGKIEVRKEISN